MCNINNHFNIVSSLPDESHIITISKWKPTISHINLKTTVFVHLVYSPGNAGLPENQRWNICLFYPVLPVVMCYRNHTLWFLYFKQVKPFIQMYFVWIKSMLRYTLYNWRTLLIKLKSTLNSEYCAKHNWSYIIHNKLTRYWVILLLLPVELGQLGKLLLCEGEIKYRHRFNIWINQAQNI